MACRVELEKVGSPIGKQDQYAAACGGLNFISFYGDESVTVEKIIMNAEKKRELDDNLYMFYIGGEHSANEILRSQQAAISKKDKFDTQRRMVGLAFDLKDSLENNNIDDMGHILHEGWLMKKSLTNGISNGPIDELYDYGLRAGASGGKLLGAGGAGSSSSIALLTGRRILVKWRTSTDAFPFRHSRFKNNLYGRYLDIGRDYVPGELSCGRENVRNGGKDWRADGGAVRHGCPGAYFLNICLVG